MRLWFTLAFGGMALSAVVGRSDRDSRQANFRRQRNDGRDAHPTNVNHTVDAVIAMWQRHLADVRPLPDSMRLNPRLAPILPDS